MKKILIGFMTFISMQTFAGDELKLFKDDRPSDGMLQELSIVPRDGNDFTSSVVKLKESYYVAMTSEQKSRISFESEKMSCERFFTTPEEDEIGTIVCLRDDRPSDGALVELTVSMNTFGTYDVSLFTSYNSMGGAQGFEKNQDLAFDLMFVKE